MESSSAQVDISGTSLGGTQIGQQNIFNGVSLGLEPKYLDIC